MNKPPLNASGKYKPRKNSGYTIEQAISGNYGYPEGQEQVW